VNKLEHVNITVRDAEATARWLCEVFGWHIRWQGPVMRGGTTVHVGDDTAYLAVYAPERAVTGDDPERTTLGGLNHVGVVVDDLAAVEAKVRAQGFAPGPHEDYEPGRRFYFHDADGIEYEVVSYA